MDPMNNSTPDYSHYDGVSNEPGTPVDNPSGTPTLSVPDIIALVIFAAVFVVGVPGNALVVWVTGSEARRTVNAIWFLNLAVADLLSCLALPILFASIVLHGDWPFGSAACCVLPSLILLNMYASILLLATISADRFVLVVNPVWCQNYRGAGLAWTACAGAWGLALLLTTPSFRYRSLHEEHFPYKLRCGVDYGKDGYGKERAVAIVRLVVGFLGPLVTLAVCYTFLLIRAWSRSATRSTKTLKVVVAVVTSFFIFWLPYQVTGMMLAFLHSSHHGFSLATSIDALCVSLAYVNCCINPIIYVVAAQGFQSRFLKTLPSVLRKVLTEETVSRESRSYTLSTMDTPSQKIQAA